MKKLFAIILAMLMVLSLAACANKDVDSNESGSDTNDTQNQTESSEKATEGKKDDDADKLPETDDEILAYVLNALSATQNYKGDISITAHSSDNVAMKASSEAGGEEMEFKNNSSEFAFATIDTTNKVIYFEEISEYDPGEDPTDADAEKLEYVYKSFYDANKLYLALKSSESEEASNVEISLVHENAYDDYTTLNDLEFLEYPTEVYSGIKLAESFDEVKAAFESALPAIMASFYTEEMANVTPTVTSEVSTKVVDGVCTFIINIKSSASATEEGSTMEMAINLCHEISAKNGKMIDFKSTIDMAQKATMGEKVLQDYSQSFDFVLEFEYSFAKEKYDAFAVTLPDNLNDIPVKGAPAEDYSDLDITLYVNGLKSFGINFDECETPQDALNEIISYIDTEKATVKVYSDEAMTKELLADTVTKEDILALENAYLSVTPKADYALVTYSYIERNEYSKPYKIVLPTLYFLSSSSEKWTDPASLFEAGLLGLDESYVADETCEIWINGVKQETKTETITIEGGKTYNIEYVTVLTDKDFAKA